MNNLLFIDEIFVFTIENKIVASLCETISPIKPSPYGFSNVIFLVPPLETIPIKQVCYFIIKIFNSIPLSFYDSILSDYFNLQPDVTKPDFNPKINYGNRFYNEILNPGLEGFINRVLQPEIYLNLTNHIYTCKKVVYMCTIMFTRDLIINIIMYIHNIVVSNGSEHTTKTSTSKPVKPMDVGPNSSNKRKNSDDKLDESSNKPISTLEAKKQRKLAQINVDIRFFDSRNTNTNVGVLLWDYYDTAGIALRLLYPNNATVQHLIETTIRTCIIINPSPRILNNTGIGALLQITSVQHNTGNGNNIMRNGYQRGMWVYPQPDRFVIIYENYSVTSRHLPLMLHRNNGTVFILD